MCLASYSQRLLMFDGSDGSFRNIKLRSRQPHCTVCGDKPSITQLVNYEQFCGASATDKVGIQALHTGNEDKCIQYLKVRPTLWAS